MEKQVQKSLTWNNPNNSVTQSENLIQTKKFSGSLEGLSHLVLIHTVPVEMWRCDCDWQSMNWQERRRLFVFERLQKYTLSNNCWGGNGRVSTLLFTSVPFIELCRICLDLALRHSLTHIHKLTLHATPVFGFPPPFSPSVWKPDLQETHNHLKSGRIKRVILCENFEWWVYLDGVLGNFDLCWQLLSCVHVCVLAVREFWFRRQRSSLVLDD